MRTCLMENALLKFNKVPQSDSILRIEKFVYPYDSSVCFASLMHVALVKWVKWSVKYALIISEGVLSGKG